MENIEISVIVPVYNVEYYIHNCVKSILNQTFKDFELLLIDDGSTDNSGKICDRYAKRYSTVKVFHKVNGGLSDARNYGMKLAKGKYFVFIDSDDFVELNYLEVLFNLVKKYNVQMACLNSVREYKSDFNLVGKYIDSNNIEGVIDKKKALKKMLIRDGFGVNAWAKIYSKKLFKDVEYPKGKLYEDLQTVPYLVAKCDKVAFSSLKLYHYVKRNNSILNRQLTNTDLTLISYLSILGEYLEKNFPDLIEAFEYRYVSDVLKVLINRAVFLENYHEVLERIFMQNVIFWKNANFNVFLSKREKIQIYVAKNFPRLYKNIIKIVIYSIKVKNNYKS
ncbi:glycosyltransferase [Liquorilactobacillus aquaticus DSM 21051]|uniref:Glycosyltransferase n=1 Tax=Liquorilactobacillus aquaticus DSM 21051 TaxID=1423725 RepID=A0A0R2CU02_9LACO|nr:glycosyltransferase family 2 protein [Liquorilactobacillus aquaticus]KRM94885.1 glycosyltransferase [Liquorilactobacillus aquaticus DSM 21051]